MRMRRVQVNEDEQNVPLAPVEGTSLCCSDSQCAAVCCSVLQCVAVCCSGIQQETGKISRRLPLKALHYVAL